MSEYERFRSSSVKNYKDFSNKCDEVYADFLRTSWKWYEGKEPLPLPEDLRPVSPNPILDEDTVTVIAIPEIVEVPEDEDISVPYINDDDNSCVGFETVMLNFIGRDYEIRMPKDLDIAINNPTGEELSLNWIYLSMDDHIETTINDCLLTKDKYGLCDWAYFKFIEKLCHEYCTDNNVSTFLMAYLYSHSGYQMRLAVDGSEVVMLFGSKYQIYDYSYFTLDDLTFYAFKNTSDKLLICDVPYDGEKPMSLAIVYEQPTGGDMSNRRDIRSNHFGNIEVSSRVPKEIIDFYQKYPVASINNDFMTRWAIYANTPMTERTKKEFYPKIKQSIAGCEEVDAVNRILCWVQTGFEYAFDDDIWGHDRAFFAEETLYYPYSDCEDRAILFTRLIRDILGLDTALVYFPEHLAAAVKFDTTVTGMSIKLGDDSFIICEPTCSCFAPAGARMEGLDYASAKALVLK